MDLIWNTISLAVTTALLSLLIGTWFAWGEQRGLYAGKKILCILNLLPLAIPSYLLAGTLRETFGRIFTGFWPTVIVLLLITIPYVQLIISSTLMRISRNEEDAARILGCTPWQVFYKIILPQLRPGLAFAWLLIQLYVISDFGAIAILDYPALTWRLYQAVTLYQLDRALLLSGYLLLLTLPVLIIGRLIHRHMGQYRGMPNPQIAEAKKLSACQKLFTYFLHILLIGLGFILPVCALASWVWNGLAQQLSFAPLTEYISDTLIIGLSGSLFILLIAFLSVRIKIQFIYMLNALPGILMAFAILFAALWFSRFAKGDGALYGMLLKSGVLLLLGYTLRFLPNAHANLKPAVERLNPHLWDNARLLGASRWRWFWEIAVPALFPSVSAAFILVFLSILKELPITLLLGNAMGVHMLNFRIFDRYQEALLHDAGLAGLVLLTISLCFVLLTHRWRHYV
ncbi:MAG: ABC transporter permease [Gammaproteobacteria bacterium]